MFVLTAAGGATFTDIVGGTSSVLPAGSVQISGNTITAELPLSLAISEGLAPEQYGFNLWPRGGAGGNALIADFAPDASDFRIPEPGSLAMLGVGLMGLLGARRRNAR